jgi:protein N-terminal methyltransferase
MPSSSPSAAAASDDELFITLKNEPKGYDVQTLEYHASISDVWRDRVVAAPSQAQKIDTISPVAAEDAV